MKTTQGYARVQIALHWLIAILIYACYFISDGMGRALRTRLETGQTGFEGNTLHVWLGMAAAALIVIRILLRVVLGAPGAIPGAPPMAHKAHIWGQRLLYLLMLFAPIPGLVAWYGGVRDAGDVHALVGNALVLIATAHAAIALLHHFVLKDETLTRMVPLLKRGA